MKKPPIYYFDDNSFGKKATEEWNELYEDSNQIFESYLKLNAIEYKKTEGVDDCDFLALNVSKHKKEQWKQFEREQKAIEKKRIYEIILRYEGKNV